jgi:hypothetical protein
MASVSSPPRPPIGLTILLLVAVVVIGFLATQWIVGIVLSIIRLILILIGFYLIARIGMYLLRKGR